MGTAASVPSSSSFSQVVPAGDAVDNNSSSSNNHQNQHEIRSNNSNSRTTESKKKWSPVIYDHLDNYIGVKNVFPLDYLIVFKGIDDIRHRTSFKEHLDKYYEVFQVERKDHQIPGINYDIPYAASLIGKGSAAERLIEWIRSKFLSSIIDIVVLV
jgi:hypothetical protein